MLPFPPSLSLYFSSLFFVSALTLRINAYFGKPMLFEDLYPPNLEEELRSTCHLSSHDVAQFLYEVFDDLLQLPQGEYLLHHAAGKDHVDVLKAVAEDEAYTHNLDKYGDFYVCGYSIDLNVTYY